MKPGIWNVVVLGHWNPAILTPAGIARRLFRLPEGTPVDVQVPINALGPYRVQHDGVVVVADAERLIVEAASSYAALEHARDVAALAIKDLPETPLSAAGFNIRFQSERAPVEMLRLIEVKLDDALAADSFIVRERTLQRSIEWKQGSLNVEIRIDTEASAFVGLNFHCSSQRYPTLLEWLAVPVREVEETVQRILKSVGAEERTEVEV